MNHAAVLSLPRLLSRVPYLLAGLPGTQAHGLEPGQEQHITDAQAHALTLPSC